MPTTDEELPPVDGRIFRSEQSARRSLIGVILAVFLLYGVTAYMAWRIVTGT